MLRINHKTRTVVKTRIFRGWMSTEQILLELKLKLAVWLDEHVIALFTQSHGQEYVVFYV